MRTNHRSRRGSNAVEFALTLPILIVMVAGVIDYSWYFSQHASVVSAVRDGCRAASVVDNQANAVADAQATTTAALADSDLDGGAVVNAAIVVMGNGESGIQVQATTPYQPVVNFPLLPSPANLTFQLTMRLEDQLP